MNTHDFFEFLVFWKTVLKMRWGGEGIQRIAMHSIFSSFCSIKSRASPEEFLMQTFLTASSGSMGNLWRYHHEWGRIPSGSVRNLHWCCLYILRSAVTYNFIIGQSRCFFSFLSSVFYIEMYFSDSWNILYLSSFSLMIYQVSLQAFCISILFFSLWVEGKRRIMNALGIAPKLRLNWSLYSKEFSHSAVHRNTVSLLNLQYLLRIYM